VKDCAVWLLLTELTAATVAKLDSVKMPKTLIKRAAVAPTSPATVMSGGDSVEAGLMTGVRREVRAEREIFIEWQTRPYARGLARELAMLSQDRGLE